MRQSAFLFLLLAGHVIGQGNTEEQNAPDIEQSLDVEVGFTRLILIAPLDLLWYRPILAYAHLKGLVQFLRGDKTWDRFDRNVRQAASSPRIP
jgi:hypothetical protein